MRRIKIKRPGRSNPHCSYHYGGQCQNPSHNHYGAYGFYGATAKLAKLYKVGTKYDVNSIKRLGELLSSKFPDGTGGTDFFDESIVIGEMIDNTDGLYSTKIQDVVKNAQISLGLLVNGQPDGLVGPTTWRKLGASTAETPTAGTSGSSGGSSDSPDDVLAVGTTTTIKDEVWFYPAVGIGGLGLLVILLKMLKRKKKKKSSQMRMNRW